MKPRRLTADSASSAAALVAALAIILIAQNGLAYHPTDTESTTSTTLFQPCIDSDGGRNHYVKGVVQGRAGFNYTDVCTTYTTLQEGFCDVRGHMGIVWEQYECPNGCFEGACLRNRTLTGGYSVDWSGAEFVSWAGLRPDMPTTQANDVTDSSAQACADTDGGIDITAKGDVFVNGRKVWGDTCIDSSQLTEGFCDLTKARKYSTETVYCEKGCLNGACRA